MGHLYKLDFSGGKSYIGITTKSAEHRFAGHKKAAAAGRMDPVYCAWRKHGEPKLTLLAIMNDEDLPDAEVRAIKAHRSLVPDGYNISAGGSLSPMRHECAKAKVSARMLQLWSDPERAARWSEGMRGNTNRKGQKNSELHVAKVSAALKGKTFTDAHKAALREGWIKRKQNGFGAPWNKGLTS